MNLLKAETALIPRPLGSPPIPTYIALAKRLGKVVESQVGGAVTASARCTANRPTPSKQHPHSARF